MTLQISLSQEAETRLRECAAASGEDVASYVSRILDQALRKPSLEEKLAPVRRAFEQSEMTEDQLSELLEREKHAIRAEGQF